MHLAIVLLIAALQTTQHDPQYVSLFTPLEYRYTGGAYKNELFKYRLFVPTPTTSREKQPLLVWLHGRGEAGDDNTAQLALLYEFIFPLPWEKGRYPFFFLAVQCPPANPDWTRSDPAMGDDMVNVVAAIIQEAIHKYAADPNRIYLIGISNGGTGCWELASRHPELFAAVAPMGSSGIAGSRLKPLVKIPIWAFHNLEDPAVPIQYDRNTVGALKKAGGKTHLTETDAESINCWSTAFRDYYLLDWLLSQRRGQTGAAVPPGTIVQPKDGEPEIAPRPVAPQAPRGWLWWQVVLQALVLSAPFVIAWTIVRYLRRRSQGVLENG